MMRSFPLFAMFITLVICSASVRTLAAQQLILSDASVFSSLKGELPDAPDVTFAQAADPSETASLQQTKRILGIIPNFRAVNANTHLPAQSPKDKFTTALQDSFDYSSFIFVGIQSSVSMATKSTPQFHQGAAGYARYYWHTFADTADENLWVEGILPSALHEDNRYYTLGHGNIFKRAGYAFTRTLVTRSDTGHETFNASEIIGAGAAAGISSAYYPSADRTWTKVGQRWLTSTIIDGGTFVFKEFWPDVNGKLFHTH